MSKRASTLTVVGALALLLSACGAEQQGPPGGQMPPPEVGVVKVESGDVPLQQELVGRLAAFRSADVRARVPGVVQQRLYEEGTPVEKGQVLFQIDPAPLQTELNRAQASLAQARASYLNAKAAADRARTLLPEKYISQSDYDAAIAAERSAQAAVQAAEAAVQTARINLGYASVEAPIAGIAGKQQVTEGALVGQGTATLLTTVDQIDPLYVNFSMGVSELQRIRRLRADSGEAPKVQVVLPDGTVYEHPGVLDFSGDVVDPATGAVALRARVPNPDKVLLPGTYVSLNATLGKVEDAVLVPKVAVQRDPQGAFVLVVGADGKVVRRDVVAEYGKGDNWVVTAGLEGGEQVIVSGLQRAQPGQPATPVPAQPQGQPAAAGAAAPAEAAPQPGATEPTEDAEPQD
jgi:membrane fusion protein (multidrug efflux system)